jgi:5-methylcytosine-specific restriction endonuclease McrA
MDVCSEVKLCRRCNDRKPTTEFHKNKRKSDGLDIYCKACNSARLKAKYYSDVEWRKNKINKTRQYHLDNPEWSRERLRAHHEAHFDERMQAHRNRMADPVKRAKSRESTRRSESRRRAIKAKSSQVEFITENQLSQKLASYDNKCWICEREFSAEVVLNWDHFHPLAKGGAHTLTNLRPACYDCNVRKNGLWPITGSVINRIKKSTLQRVASRREGGD